MGGCSKISFLLNNVGGALNSLILSAKILEFFIFLNVCFVFVALLGSKGKGFAQGRIQSGRGDDPHCGPPKQGAVVHFHRLLKES